MPATNRSASTLGRRQFIGWTAAGAAGAALVARPGIAGAAPTDTVVVYGLEADWGTPIGPHGKTRLVSNASRQAAANRIARTAADAEAMNLHLCSLAPSRAITLHRSEFDAVWARHSYSWQAPWSGQTVQILDLRQVRADPESAVLWRRAVTRGQPDPTLVDDPDPAIAAPSAPGAAPLAAPRLAGTRSASAAPTRQLADTGADLGATKVGAALLATGAALLAIARRGDRVSRTDRDSSPPPTC